MIQHAGILIETVHRREVFIAVAQVVLTELPRGVTVVLQELGNGRIFEAESLLGARHADL